MVCFQLLCLIVKIAKYDINKRTVINYSVFDDPTYSNTLHGKLV